MERQQQHFRRRIGQRVDLETNCTAMSLFAVRAVSLAACGSSPLQTSTSSTPTLRFNMYSAQANARSSPDYRVSLSVSCKPGEQMLGGGFYAYDTFEYDALISAIYPSSLTTWTVTGNSSSQFSLEAEVYCLQRHTSLGLQLVQGGPRDQQATCPPGSMLVSGGGEIAGPYSTTFLASQPAQNGWVVMASSSAARVSALCATRSVRQGTIAMTHFNVRSPMNNNQPTGLSVHCPPGQFTTGGGFNGGNLATGSSTTMPFEAWRVDAGGNGTETVFAVCNVLA